MTNDILYAHGFLFGCARPPIGRATVRFGRQYLPVRCVIRSRQHNQGRGCLWQVQRCFSTSQLSKMVLFIFLKPRATEGLVCKLVDSTSFVRRVVDANPALAAT